MISFRIWMRHSVRLQIKIPIRTHNSFYFHPDSRLDILGGSCFVPSECHRTRLLLILITDESDNDLLKKPENVFREKSN